MSKLNRRLDNAEVVGKFGLLSGVRASFLAKIGMPKLFFGWWTVLAGALLAFWGHGYFYYGLSALFKPIASELGFSRAVTSVAASIGRLEGGFEAILIGWLVDRFGPRWIVVTGVFLAGLGLVLMNWVNSLWAYYVVWGVIAATGVNIGTAAPLEKAISNWFVKKRGLALSIRWGVAGLCVVSVLPLVAWLITVCGWRMTCVIGGVVMWIMGLPLAWFCVKQERPEYYGLLPDGASAIGETSGGQMIDRGVKYAEEVQEVEFTLRQAMSTRTYWLLMVAQMGHGMLVPVVIVHSIPFLTDMGMDAVRAAAMIGTISLTSIVTRFVSGFMADRIRTNHLRFLMSGSYFLQTIGLFALLLNPSVAMAYVFFILYYSAFGVTLPLGSIMRARYFGRKAFGSIGGVSMVIMTPIGVIAPIYAGWVYDSTGNYMAAFALFAGLLAFSTILASFVFPPKPPATITDIRKFV